MGLFTNVGRAVTGMKAWKRLKEEAMKGNLKVAVFGLAGLIVTAIIAKVTSACPELIPNLGAVATAAVGGAWAYWRQKESASQSLLFGILGAGFAAGMLHIKVICGDEFVTALPTLLTAGLWTGIGAWLKSPRSA